MNEFISFQLGPYSNFVGSCSWKHQKFDVQGENRTDTYSLIYDGQLAARAVIVDFEDRLRLLQKPLSFSSGLKSPKPAAKLAWDGVVKKVEQPLAPPSAQFSTDNWSMLMKDSCCSYLDRSIISLSSVFASSGSVRNESVQFTFLMGENMSNSNSVTESIESAIRFFTEKSDRPTGFPIMLDPINGFGALAGFVNEYLADECRSAPRWDFLCYKPSFHDANDVERLFYRLNLLLTVHRLFEPASFIIPFSLNRSYYLSDMNVSLQFPNVGYQAANDFHSACILSSIYDTIAMVFKHSNLSMSSISDCLTGATSSKLGILGASLPFPQHKSQSLLRNLFSFEKAYPWVNLAADELMLAREQMHYNGLFVLRGLEDQQARIIDVQGFQQSVSCLSANTSVQDVFQQYIRDMISSDSVTFTNSKPYVIDSQMFPCDMMSKNLSTDGFIDDYVRVGPIKSMPVCSCIVNGGETSLKGLRRSLSLINVNDICQKPFLLSDGCGGSMERDDVVERFEFLQRLCPNEVAFDNDD